MNAQNKKAEISLAGRIYAEKLSEVDYDSRKDILRLPGLLDLRDKMVLEVGCGAGIDGVIISRCGNEVVGIDISSKAAGIALRRARKERCNMCVIVGDMESLPFKDSSFDVCFYAWVLHHLPNAKKAVLEAFRVLGRQGEIIVVEPNGDSLAVKISKFFEARLAALIVKACADTPNETLHSLRYYRQVLQEGGFAVSTVGLFYFGGLPPLPNTGRLLRTLFLILVNIRRVLYLAITSFSSGAFSGIDMFMRGKVTAERRVLSARAEEGALAG